MQDLLCLPLLGQSVVFAIQMHSRPQEQQDGAFLIANVLDGQDVLRGSRQVGPRCQVSDIAQRCRILWFHEIQGAKAGKQGHAKSFRIMASLIFPSGHLYRI